MEVKETAISTWHDLDSVRKSLPHVEPLPHAANMLYRGEDQRNVGLIPTLLREIRNLPVPVTVERAVEIEHCAEVAFFESAHLHIDIPRGGLSFRDGWALMQHHGAPTRLLDWTRSFYVAVYFAVDDLDNAKASYVWLFDYARFCSDKKNTDIPDGVDAQAEFLLAHRSESLLAAVQSTRKTDRMVIQQGAFTLCTNPMVDHLQILGPYLRKLVIAGDAKLECVRRLREMNITAASLFPGIDGLGRTVTDTVRIFARR